jgi:hypothetical protein
MDPLERGDLEAALARAAREGDWGAAKALVEELGPRAWGRRSLMGDSAEGLAFERALRAEPGLLEPLDWIESQGSDAQRRDRLEERLASALKAGLARDEGARAGAMLAACAGLVPAREELSKLADQESFDAGPWARRMAQNVRSGAASRDWSERKSFWRLAQKAASAGAEEAEELFNALGKARMLRPFVAAEAGAGEMARRWMEGLSEPMALALLAAASSQSRQDWDDFEAVCGSEAGDAWAAREGLSIEDGGGWRALAAAAACAQGEGDDAFESLGVGASWGDLSRNSRDATSSSAWTQTLEACAARAAGALEDPRLGQALEWIAKQVPATAAAKAAPGLTARGDLSGLAADEVLESLRRLSAARAGALEAAARSGAKRLWALEQEPARDGEEGAAAPSRSLGSRFGHDETTPLRQAAMELWTGDSPKALEAFLEELSSLAGSAWEASRACGLPQALRWERGMPGAPGNVAALIRVIGPGVASPEGRSAWMDSDGASSDALSTVMGSCAIAGRLALLESGGGSGPAPGRLSGLIDLASWDLGERRWLPGQGPRAAEEGWEAALEALVWLGRELGVGPAGCRPPSQEDGIAPSRNAWAAFAQRWPEDVAERLAKGWLVGGASALRAGELASWLGSNAKALVGKAFPRALMSEATRAARSGLGVELGDGPAARACREASLALRPSAPEALCAAALCACAVGLAAAAVKDLDSSQRKAARLAATGLAEFLPLASATSTKRWQGEGAGSGFCGSDLGARGARAALELKASGMVDGPLGLDVSDWEGVELDAASPWTAGCLGGLFTEAAWRNGEDHGAAARAALWKSAFEWAASSGAGLGREPGGPSALELAVDARAGQLQDPSGRRHSQEEPETSVGSPKTFGEVAIQALVSLGADPSDPQAPGGWDALALCSRLERSQSASSAMKALMASSKARPGRGMLWGRLGAEKTNFSPKLVSQLSQLAREGAELEGLARLGRRMGMAQVAREMEQALKAPAARALGPDLLEALANDGASDEACEKVAKALAAVGVEPSEASRVALGRRAAQELAKDSPWGLDQRWARWARSGAVAIKLTEELVGEQAWGAWRALDFKTEPALGEMACALALRELGEGKRGNPGASRAGRLMSGALELPAAMAGRRFHAAMCKAWDNWAKRAWSRPIWASRAWPSLKGRR